MKRCNEQGRHDAAAVLIVFQPVLAYNLQFEWIGLQHAVSCSVKLSAIVKLSFRTLVLEWCRRSAVQWSQPCPSGLQSERMSFIQWLLLLASDHMEICSSLYRLSVWKGQCGVSHGNGASLCALYMLLCVLEDWIVQCFTSPPTQYRLYGRRVCVGGCPLCSVLGYAFLQLGEQHWGNGARWLYITVLMWIRRQNLMVFLDRLYVIVDVNVVLCVASWVVENLSDTLSKA